MGRTTLNCMVALATFCPALLCAEILDTLRFGDGASENSHGYAADFSTTAAGGLGEMSRHLLPGGVLPWQGGTMKFSVNIDPVRQNYFTIRLWGR